MIIGGGASGVLIAAQLLHRSHDATVHIFERSGELGKGIAYSTENPNHLLNVRASNMSAYPDEPDHFYNWLLENHSEKITWELGSFAPRKLYREYLNALLEPYLETENPRLFIERDEIVEVTTDRGRPVVLTISGHHFSGSAVIVATGNEAAIVASGRDVAEYWSSNGYFDIPSENAVAIFGTGLSMVDSVISLLDRGHTGKIHAISRRGLLPARHQHSEPFVIQAENLPIAEGISNLLHRVRDMMRRCEAEGKSWRSVIDGLRPHTSKIWSRLPIIQRKSFLRHLRPWWDVHRHRMAPKIADRIDLALASGQLTITAAHLLSVKHTSDHISIRYRKRHLQDAGELAVSTVIDCRGGSSRFSTTRNSAIISLMEQGLAKPDALDLGFDVTHDMQILNARGEPSGPFFAIGPVTRGMFWEVTAVPDIRVQAQSLALVLLNG